MDDKQLPDGSFRFVDVKSAADGQLTIDYRLLRGAPFAGKLTFEFHHEITAGAKPKTVSKRQLEPQELHSDPFVFRAVRSFPGGAGKVTVTIAVDDRVVLADEFELSTALTGSQGNVRRDPPRLVLDINDTPRSSPALDPSLPDPQKLLAILTRVDQLLQRGLSDTAWLGPSSGRGLTLEEMDLSDEAREEERWARRVSEMMLLCPYFFSGTIYGTGLDKPIYQAMDARISAGNDAFYPIIIQCQQLCQVMLLARGVPFGLFRDGVNAGDSEGLPAFRSSNQGAVHTATATKSAQAALAASPPVAPGTLYQFSIKGQPNTGAAHIGMVLRVQDGPWKALQTFDTGGLNAPGRGQGVRLAAVKLGELGGGVFDDPWVQQIRGTSAPFSGALVIGKQHKPPSNLSAWWPAGFVRLIVRRRATRELVYATPLLRMHNGVRDFPYSVLANALRGAPGQEEFETSFQVSAPRGDLAKTAVFTGDRSATVRDVLGTTGVPPERPLSNNVKHIFLLADIVQDADGIVRKVEQPKDARTQATAPDRLPWGVRSGSLAAAVPLGSVPPYLQGGES